MKRETGKEKTNRAGGKERKEEEEEEEREGLG